MGKICAITLSRTPKFFRRLTESVGGPAFDLNIVVNNGQCPEITEHAIRNGWASLNPGHNLSFSEGNNKAAKIALNQGCSHLLLINDDAIASPSFCLGVRESAHLAEPILGFRITDDGKVNHDGARIGIEGDYLAMTDHINRGGDVNPPPKPIVEVPAVTFAAALVDAAAWADLGGLDEGYFYGWEDTDLCLRSIESGGTVRVHRGISVEHSECGTRIRNGQTNQENSDKFQYRWRDRLVDLFAEYRERHPSAEGLGFISANRR